MPASEGLVAGSPESESSEDASRERLEFLLARSTTLIYSIEMTEGFPITFVSANIRELLGMEPEQVTGNPNFWESHCHPLDKERTLLAMTRLFEEPRVPLEARVMHADGSYRWFRHDGRIITDPVRGTTELLASAVDITPSRQSEVSLSTLESTFHRLFEDSPLGTVLVGTNSTLLRANNTLCEMLEPSEAELCEPNIGRLVHAEDRDAIVESIERLLNGELSFFQSKARLLTKSGRSVACDISASPIYDSENRIAYGLGMIHDLSQRVRAEEERDRIFDMSFSMMCTIDFDGHLRLVNPAFNKALGYPPGGLSGRHFADLVHADDRDFVSSTFEKLKTNQRTPGRDTRWVCKDGSHRWLSWRLAPVPDESIVCAVGQDVTDRRNAAAALQERSERAADDLRLSSMSLLAAQIARELQQPLCAMVNYANGISRRLQEEDDGHDWAVQGAKGIAEQGLRAGRLLEHIQVLGRHAEPAPRWIDVSEVAARAVEWFRMSAQAAEVSLTLDLTEDLPRAHVDPVQIEQVIISLLRNSLESLQAGGYVRNQVRLKVSLSSDRRIEVEISDTGKGLDETEQERVFEPFFSTKASGVGTGLSISRQIIEAHGGRLCTNTDKSEGAEFSFTLPTTRPNPE